ncbi:MAG: MFS transporter [Deltaproteobacteria bacterium]|nr:MFS transporter [Deltaproteobacteria bacterium]
MSDKRVSFWRLSAYASPAYISGAIMFPTLAILPAFYAKHAGISLAVIGTLLVVGRIFDAVTDPVLGYLSDITKTRLGRRKPWVLGGFILAMVSVYFFYVPAADVGVAYFTVWFLLIFLAFTMIDIPHRAWGTEISRHYDERSRISTYVGLAVQLGSLTFAVIPLVPVFASQGYNSETLRFIAFFFVGLMPFIALAATVWGPEGKPVATEKPSIMGLFNSVKGNKPFWFFIAVYIVSGLGNGMFFSLIYLYSDTYMQLGHRFPYFLVADAMFTFVVIPVWLKIIYRYGKHRSWAVGNAIGSVVLVGMIFFDPGEASFIPFFVLVGIRAMFVACYYVVPMALLGDVIDYDILKTGANRSANYFSAMTLTSKLNYALGGGLGFIIIGAFGYTVDGPNSDIANLGIIFSTLILPAVLLVSASFMLWFFPIDHRRQSIIRRRIESRAQRAERNGKLLTNHK